MKVNGRFRREMNIFSIISSSMICIIFVFRQKKHCPTGGKWHQNRFSRTVNFFRQNCTLQIFFKKGKQSDSSIRVSNWKLISIIFSMKLKRLNLTKYSDLSIKKVPSLLVLVGALFGNSSVFTINTTTSGDLDWFPYSIWIDGVAQLSSTSALKCETTSRRVATER